MPQYRLAVTRSLTSLFVAAFALLAAPVLCQLPPGAVRLPFQHPVLTVTPAHGQLIVCQGLFGVAWVPLKDGFPSAPPILIPDWMTLSALELEEDRVLLVGRDLQMRVIQFNDDRSSATVVSQWAAEGLPLHASPHSGVLAVSQGGSGINLHDWTGPRDQPPHLIGRYPFVEFAREAVWLDHHTLAAATGDDSGLQVLDLADPRRPRLLVQATPYSYCDAVATISNSELFLSLDRFEGVRLCRLTPDRQNLESHQLLAPVPHPPEQARANDVKVEGDTVWIAENFLGVREFQFASHSSRTFLTETRRFPLPPGGAAVDVTKLPGQPVLALAAFQAGVIFYPLDSGTPVP